MIFGYDGNETDIWMDGWSRYGDWVWKMMVGGISFFFFFFFPSSLRFGPAQKAQASHHGQSICNKAWRDGRLGYFCFCFFWFGLCGGGVVLDSFLWSFVIFCDLLGWFVLCCLLFTFYVL